MASKLTKLTQEHSAAQIQARTKESYQWFIKKIAEIRNPSSVARGIKTETDREQNTVKLGRLYMYYYDPKTKADLPYYDKFPLVLVLEKYNDGFLGLNIHYLPIKYRVAFMNKLMDYAVMKGDEIQRMRVTYDILSASRRFREFRPCLKRYLRSHLKSKILAVEPHEWEAAVYLPMYQFKKAKPQEVWKESVETIRNS